MATTLYLPAVNNQAEDIKVLQEYLGKESDVLVVELKSVKDHPFLLRIAPDLELPALAVGNDFIQGPKTISTFIASKRPKLLGLTNVEKAEVDQWLTFCNTTVKPALETKNLKLIREMAKVLNEALLHRTYFCGNYLTVADIILYCNLHSYFETLPPKQRVEACNLSRWFDLMQHTPKVNLKREKIEFDLDPPVEKGAESQEKPKEKAQDKAQEKAQEKPKEKAPEKSQEKAPEKVQEKAQEKGKKAETQPKEKKAAAAPAKKEEDEGDSGNVDISKINLMVGLITDDVRKHENADSLYVEKIEVGEAKPRNVVSGLVKFVPIDQMKNRLVVIVANMKPAAMRGITSEAMVLCATSPDGNTVEFVEPPAGSKPGDKVYVEGFEGAPDAVLNPKKKTFEKVQPDLRTNDEKVACYKGVPLRTSSGICTVKTVVGGTIK